MERLFNQIIQNHSTSKPNSRIQYEIEKGCSRQIYNVPVSLEPPYTQFLITDALEEVGKDNRTVSKAEMNQDLRIMKLWLAQKENYSVTLNEEILNELSFISQPISFEVVGNAKNISIQIVTDSLDSEAVKNTYTSKMFHSNIEFTSSDRIKESLKLGCQKNRNQYAFDLITFIPEPPYHRTLSVPDNSLAAPLNSFISALSKI